MSTPSKNTITFRKWRLARIIVALVMIVIITLSFTFLGKELHVVNQTLQLQFIPALIAFTGGSIAALIFILLLTLVFGRVYCSWLCPLGIYQDIVSRLAGIFKSKKGRQHHYTKPHNWLRFSITMVLVILLALGLAYPIMLLDPYSIFGRFASMLFNPILQLISNGIALIFPDSVYYRPISGIVLGAFIITSFFFLLVTALSAWRSRLYCNTVCPVGSILGAVSHISVFRPAIDRSMCVSCGQCEKICKSECIDAKGKTINEGRCVMCLDCMSVCPRGGITLESRWKHAKGLPEEEKKVETRGRREAIAVLGGIAAFVAVKRWKKSLIRENKRHDALPPVSTISGIVPPGGRGVESLIENCTACHACVAACPNGIISVATGEYGASGLFLPVIHYDKSFCGYNCRKCISVCPAGALENLTLAQKQLTKIGQARFTLENCVVFKAHTDCGACDEHCPTKAITMQDAEDGSGLRFPRIDGHYCIGCGGCEYICPATPKAMKVVPMKRHLVALPPKKEEQPQKSVDDFGF